MHHRNIDGRRSKTTFNTCSKDEVEKNTLPIFQQRKKVEHFIIKCGNYLLSISFTFSRSNYDFNIFVCLYSNNLVRLHLCINLIFKFIIQLITTKKPFPFRFTSSISSACFNFIYFKLFD